MGDNIAGNATKYPGIIRASVIFHNVSNLPADRFVNTFHFTGAANDTTYQGIAGLLRDFYWTNYQANSLDHWFSPVIYYPELRMYDLNESDPRTPHGPTDAQAWRTGWSPGGSQALPNEVAVTLSYYTDKNAPRKRGRLFIGPLSTMALETPSASHPDARVDDGLRAAVNASAYALAHQLVVPNVEWVLLSPTAGGSAGAVQKGWCDDAFDTIRKRGAKASVRSAW
jgi:hypothetical protein